MPLLAYATRRVDTAGAGLVLLLLSLLCLTPLPATGQGAIPQRIVSLDLCTDWMLAYYVPKENVAALSVMQQRYPIPWSPEKWVFHDNTLEALVALKPDVVLAGEYTAILLRKQLEYLGLRVEVLPLPDSPQAVIDYERRFLGLLGHSPERASKMPEAKPPASKRLLLLGANGIGTGSGTLEDALLKRSGWRNYVAEKGYIRLDLEKIILDPPDAVLWAAPPNASLANLFARHPAWKAVKPAPRWFVTDYWRWQCPGPWSWELARFLEEALLEMNDAQK